jgi:hypothetical protein
MEAMRFEVARLITEGVAPALPTGRPPKGSDTTFSEPTGRGAEYVIARHHPRRAA